MIGELAAIRAAELGGRSVFLLPTRALVNEQYARFSAPTGRLGLQTIRATGETADDVPAFLQGQFDLAVLTYEKFAGLALGDPHLLKLLSVVVIDEVQTIVDPGRGAYLEFLLTLLKARRPEGVAPQVVALSAVLGDLGGLDSWLDVNVIARTERPVPLLEGVLGPEGIYRYVDGEGDEATEKLIAPPGWVQRNQDVIIPLVRKLVGQGQQVIIFRSTRGATRGCARYLAQSLGLPQAKAAWRAWLTPTPVPFWLTCAGASPVESPSTSPTWRGMRRSSSRTSSVPRTAASGCRASSRRWRARWERSRTNPSRVA